MNSILASHPAALGSILGISKKFSVWEFISCCCWDWLTAFHCLVSGQWRSLIVDTRKKTLHRLWSLEQCYNLLIVLHNSLSHSTYSLRFSPSCSGFDSLIWLLVKNLSLRPCRSNWSQRTRKKFFFGYLFLAFATNCICEIHYLSTTTKIGSSRHGIRTRWVRGTNATSVLCSSPRGPRRLQR